MHRDVIIYAVAHDGPTALLARQRRERRVRPSGVHEDEKRKRHRATLRLPARHPASGEREASPSSGSRRGAAAI